MVPSKIDLLYNSQKLCIRCNKWKVKEEFHIFNNYLSSYCKECARENQKELYYQTAHIKENCPCGAVYSVSNKRHHIKSKKHQRYLIFLEHVSKGN